MYVFCVFSSVFHDYGIKIIPKRRKIPVLFHHYDLRHFTKSITKQWKILI